VLGAIPLAEAQRASIGNARILLRPEQLRLSDRPAKENAWRVTSVEHVGASARVSIEHPDEAQTLTFDTAARDIPAPGSMVSIAIAGMAHLFEAIAA
jgi:ABC-type sugar transport system ATPase subunit